jgi:nucleoside-diphosphate-sugar epimerase
LKKVLLTGAAGFIGWRTGKFLLEKGVEVVGIDNMNDYYDVRLKEYRKKDLEKYKNFKFYKVDIENLGALEVIFSDHKFDCVLNLAARAGVRYSMLNPFVYMTTNANGTLNLLELMKKYQVKKMVLASTSSLYAGQPMPFKEDLPVNTPISPYAASKKAAEVMAYTYHYLYGIDVSVVRYFTVYGPAGRPDMSIFRFIKWIDEGKPIILYGDGSQSRDFTYVDDIAEGTILATKELGYEIINLGGGKNPISLKTVIETIEKHLGKKAKIDYRPFHKADLKETWADITKAEKLLGWKPKVSFEEGIKRTVEWYIENREFLKDVEVGNE